MCSGADSEGTPPPHPDHEYAALPPSFQDQLEEARKTIPDQEILIAELQQHCLGFQIFKVMINRYHFIQGSRIMLHLKLCLWPCNLLQKIWWDGVRLSDSNIPVGR
jgi:hypothetical protein